MNRQSPLFWSFPIGTWFLTHVRVSVFFPLLVLVLAYRLGDFQLGLVFSVILLFSVLMHEFGHIVAARMTGGGGDEILIWPLGGLATVRPANSFRSQFMTAAGGPIVNVMLCAVTLPAIVMSPEYNLAQALNPLQMPIDEISERVFPDLLALTFAANWILLLINLVPVYPLDGGRMLQACLSARWGGEVATEVYVRVGFFCGFLLLLGGLMFDSTWIVFIGAIVLVLNMQESFQLRMGENYDESFMGYDFSQGYTSLERADDTVPQRRPGFIRRWRDRREAEKLRREQAKQQEVEVQLDALLAKVHDHGIDSLTEAERRQLNRASARFRDKDNQG